MLWYDYPTLAALGTGEIPYATDKGAARSAIIMMAAVYCLMMTVLFSGPQVALRSFQMQGPEVRAPWVLLNSWDLKFQVLSPFHTRQCHSEYAR